MASPYLPKLWSPRCLPSRQILPSAGKSRPSAPGRCDLAYRKALKYRVPDFRAAAPGLHRSGATRSPARCVGPARILKRRLTMDVSSATSSTYQTYLQQLQQQKLADQSQPTAQPHGHHHHHHAGGAGATSQSQQTTDAAGVTLSSTSGSTQTSSSGTTTTGQSTGASSLLDLLV